MSFARLTRSLYAQVLVAVVVGAAIGHLRPGVGESMKPLGDGFIKLVKMLIAPIVFATVVTGIAKMRDLRKVGRVGLKALVYFEVVTTAALALGLVVGELVQPGAGVNANPALMDPKVVDGYVNAGARVGATEFLLGIIPTSLVDAFARGDVLQVLLVSVLLGLALASLGDRAATLLRAIDQLGQALFGVVGFVMRLAPLGALGAMAFTVGKFGIGTLLALGKLMLTFYATSALFVVLVLGLVARRCGFSLLRYLRFTLDEILIVLGTSSSESALPRLMKKLEVAGCSQPVVGMVVPMGYSFNLDGTCIYLTLATLFMAQALHVPLSLGQKLGILAVLLLTSKGAAGVTGSGFVTLAATLASTGDIPVVGLTLLLGVDRFMSEARAITNLIGNGVATIAIAAWEGELDREKLHAALRGAPAEADPLEGEHPRG